MIRGNGCSSCAALVDSATRLRGERYQLQVKIDANVTTHAPLFITRVPRSKFSSTRLVRNSTIQRKNISEPWWKLPTWSR